MKCRFLIVLAAMVLGALAAYFASTERPEAGSLPKPRVSKNAEAERESTSSVPTSRSRRVTPGSGRAAGAERAGAVDLTSLPSDDRSNEPRNDAWARSMEARLPTLYASRLAEDWPDAKLVGVTCRSTSCTVEYDLPAEEAEQIWIFLQVTMPHAPRTSPDLSDDDSTGMVRATFIAEYDDVPDIGSFESWFQATVPAANQIRDQFRAKREKGERWGR